MTDHPKPEQKVPDYAHTVVVPIANPRTAPELLNLAKGIVERDGGRIIALAVTLSDSDAEGNRDRLDELEAIVHQYKPKDQAKQERADGKHEGDKDAVNNPDIKTEEKPEEETEAPKEEQEEPPKPKKIAPHIAYDFVTRTSNSIARGILDQARESGSELIVLGVQKSTQGGVVLGSVAQAVMSAAPCDVLVYRYSETPDYSRITVPIDGSTASRMAVRMGILFANSKKHCPVEAMYVQDSARPAFEGRALIAQTLESVPGRGIVKSQVVTARNPAAAVLSRTDEDTLIIMGFSRPSEFEKWLNEGGKTMRDVLDKAPGPVVLAVRSTEIVTTRRRWQRRMISWLRPTLTDVEQEQILWDATGNAGINLDYVVLMTVSATLASLGLLLNSAAVIIGAMLVAPLMAPLNAFGVGLSTARLDLTRRSFLTAMLGVLIASGVGFFMGTVVPLDRPTSELMSRVSPTLLDAFVALASGVVGAYATARKDIPAALAGVAIAAALVPPICTFGLQLAFGELQFALGAMLLFLTNMVCIIVIAAIVFVWLGMHPLNITSESRRQYYSLVIFVILAFPTVLALLNVSQQAGEELNIDRELRRIFEPIVDVAEAETISENPMTIVATVRTTYAISPEAVAIAQDQLEERIGEDVRLQIAIERLVVAPGNTPEEIAEETNANDEALFTVVDDVVVPVSASD